MYGSNFNNILKFYFWFILWFLKGDPLYELQGGADLSFKMVR